MRIASTIFATILTSLAAAVPLHGQAAMQGIVRDDSTGRPLPGVEVLLGGTAHTTVTNAAGRYVLAGLPAGSHHAIFRIVGYLPTRVTVLLSAGDTLRVNQVLVPSTVVLDPIEVTGEPDVGLAGRGFHERMKMGFGRFYEPEELRELEHLKVSDVLRRKGGVQVMPLGRNLVAMNPYMRDEMGRLDCYMSVYLDGIMIGRGGKASSGPDVVDLQNVMAVVAIEAIEVYRSAAGIPIEFGGTSGQCGAVVIWTRRG